MVRQEVILYFLQFTAEDYLLGDKWFQQEDWTVLNKLVINRKDGQLVSWSVGQLVSWLVG